MRKLPTLAIAGVLTLASPALSMAQPTTADRFETTTKGVIDSSFTPASLNKDATVRVMVQMSADPVAVVQADKGRKLSASEKKAARATVESQQAGVKKYVQGRGGKVISSVQSAYNGVKVTVRRSELTALAGQKGVVALRPVEIMSFENSVSVPFLGVPEVWKNTGKTGAGVKVAVIDTGIDYTHADFGGPGTVAAYEAAHAAGTAPADPALFGPAAPRVKGGIDLVGDDYDAASDEAAALVPHPDANPLDCQGHGSHVSGTIGGSGVNADGSTYMGPYDDTTPGTTFKVGPGVAPEVDLYAVRVFGCEGSTDVTVEAIDWAVANDMDVINMSLGSPFGRSTDPSAVASANAVAAGVVVVASAGNSGENPYITGSPAVGKGVISVAATDSSATFPSAVITLQGGATIPAMNANGVSSLPTGPFTVVVLKDQLATPDEDESLGCSVDAYTSNGIVAGGNQIGVPLRGVCARVAKAIYGQQAGAAAVAMINTSTDFPPYEGAIFSNPDTGEAYTVTIPFLGVRGMIDTDGDDGYALAAANGDTVTLAASEMDNPGFRTFASFSSGGPGNGDSSLRPTVSAPGVSIASVAVGTGSDPAIMSGTSMAAPHVAGQAALVKQAHPTWKTADLTAAISSTADPSGQLDYRLTLGGQGLVDVKQSVTTSVVARGDAIKVGGSWVNDNGLNFGFAEVAKSYSATRSVTLVNNSARAKKFAVTVAPTLESAPAKVALSAKSVTVPAKSSTKVWVTLVVKAADVYNADASVGSQFDFKEVSGSIVATSGYDVVSVPYLLVPRAESKLTASSTRTSSSVKLAFKNNGTDVPAGVDVYTWGLSDAKDAGAPLANGFDIRAVGVQSFTAGADKLLVFAVNNWDRSSNHSLNEVDIAVDNNGDGNPDMIVFATDSGALRTGDHDGLTEVFTYDVNSGGLFASGFFADAKTDTSTVLLPVYASDLGITAQFEYVVTSFSGEDSALWDDATGSALYNPWARAIGDGGWFDVAPGAKGATGQVAVNPTRIAAQKPKGIMLVVQDNAAGAPEAVLVPVK